MAQLTKQPRLILPDVFAFAPNRETLGGTAYLIVRNDGNTLVDSPPWQPEYVQFMQDRGGTQHLLLTHRGAIGAAVEIQHTQDLRKDYRNIRLLELLNQVVGEHSMFKLIDSLPSFFSQGQF